MAKKYCYLFTEGNAKMRELLGGKGANLAEMNLVGIPVPPGFTITTEVCTEYYEKGRDAVSAALTAAHLRFRPIVMTSLAFILGMLPLVFASGPGSASRQGIGTGVFFGMLVAITVGIVFVPFFFVWIYRIKEKLKR